VSEGAVLLTLVSSRLCPFLLFGGSVMMPVTGP
jgi:hypothetical protein